MAQTAFRFDDQRMPPRKRPFQPPPRPRPNFIHAWRKSRGFTLEQLAERTGLSVSTISAIETGRAGYSRDSLEAMAVVLNCEPGDLLSRPPEAARTDDFDDLVRGMSEDERRRIIGAIKLMTGRD